MKTIDAILALRGVVAEVQPADGQLDKAFYLHCVDGHVQRIADKGNHIGMETMEEIKFAILMAYKAGNADGRD